MKQQPENNKKSTNSANLFENGSLSRPFFLSIKPGAAALVVLWWTAVIALLTCEVCKPIC